MASSPKDHTSEVTMACCMGQECTVAEGFGLANSWRHAAVTALIGFQSATARSTVGMRAVGTNALETTARGKRTTSPTPCADSGPLLRMPRHAQPHESRSEEHTSELQSLRHLVCRLL